MTATISVTPSKCRVVALQRRGDSETSDSWPGKDRLREDRASEQASGGQPEHGHGRNQRVAQWHGSRRLSARPVLLLWRSAHSRRPSRQGAKSGAFSPRSPSRTSRARWRAGSGGARRPGTPPNPLGQGRQRSPCRLSSAAVSCQHRDAQDRAAISTDRRRHKGAGDRARTPGIDVPMKGNEARQVIRPAVMVEGRDDSQRDSQRQWQRSRRTVKAPSSPGHGHVMPGRQACDWRSILPNRLEANCQRNRSIEEAAVCRVPNDVRVPPGLRGCPPGDRQHRLDGIARHRVCKRKRGDADDHQNEYTLSSIRLAMNAQNPTAAPGWTTGYCRGGDNRVAPALKRYADFEALRR